MYAFVCNAKLNTLYVCVTLYLQSAENLLLGSPYPLIPARDPSLSRESRAFLPHQYPTSIVIFVSHLSSFCGVKPWLWLQIQYSQQTSFKFVYQSSSLLLPVSHSLSLFSSSFFCPPRRGYVKLHEYYLDIKQYSILEYMKNGRSKKRGRNIEGKGREK